MQINNHGLSDVATNTFPFSAFKQNDTDIPEEEEDDDDDDDADADDDVLLESWASTTTIGVSAAPSRLAPPLPWPTATVA